MTSSLRVPFTPVTQVSPIIASWFNLASQLSCSAIVFLWERYAVVPVLLCVITCSPANVNGDVIQTHVSHWTTLSQTFVLARHLTRTPGTTLWARAALHCRIPHVQNFDCRIATNRTLLKCRIPHVQNFKCRLATNRVLLTFWQRNYFFYFNKLCIQNVNNTGTKYVRIMKQRAFWRKKNTESIYRV